MPFMGPILTRISKMIKVQLTYFKNIQKYITADSAEEKNEKKQKKVPDREEKPETISTKQSDANADVPNRVFIMGDKIVKHIRGYEL